MKIFKSAGSFGFLAVIFIVTTMLICSVMTINKKNNEINKLESEISLSLNELKESQKEMAEVKTELKNIKDTSTNINSKIEKLEKENKKLEKECSSLRKENSSLKKKASSKKPTSSTVSTQSSSSSGKKICYLTFDDGPSENTLKILDILDKYNAKATFFVINTDKIRYVKKIHDAGHTIGLHSATHNYATIYSGTDAYFSDLNKISNIVKKYTGVESKIIRFPGGSSNTIGQDYLMKKLVKQVGQKGYYYFDWNVDSMDASGNNVSYTKIRDSVLSTTYGRNSICVLMHDSGAKGSTVTALPGILKGLKKQGYVFKGLNEKSPGFHHGG